MQGPSSAEAAYEADDRDQRDLEGVVYRGHVADLG